MPLESFPEKGIEKLPEWAEAVKEHLAQLKKFSRKKLKEKLGGNLNLRGIESLEMAYEKGAIDELEYLKSVRSFLDDSIYWERLAVDEEGKKLWGKVFQDAIERENQRKEKKFY